MAHQVSYDARKAKKRKRSCSQDKSNLSTLSMIISCVSANCKLVKTQRCLLTFLLLYLHGAAALTLQGQKDGTVTFPCPSTRENVSVCLTYGSKIAYGVSQNREYHGRVQKSGNCNLTLQKLRTTDAGRYVLHLYDNGGSSFNSYDVHITCYISGWKGKELMFDELPQEAERVEHYSATGWTEMWKREQDVNRLTDKNGFLTINNFTSSDAGTYIVLNEGEVTLVTVIITESSTELKGNLNSTNDHTHVDTEHQPVWIWIVASVASVALVVIMVAVFRKLKSDPMTPTSDQDQEMRFLPGGPSVISCSGVQIT